MSKAINVTGPDPDPYAQKNRIIKIFHTGVNMEATAILMCS